MSRANLEIDIDLNKDQRNYYYETNTQNKKKNSC